MSSFLMKIVSIAVITLLVVSCGSSPPMCALKKEAPENVLNAGRLGALPVSAKKIQAETWDGFFTGKSYLRFEAEKADIELWLSSCPSLSNAVPGMLGDTQYKTNSLTPVWFRPDIRNNSRKYTIPSDTNNHNWGEVIIDDDDDTVYVTVTWS